MYPKLRRPVLLAAAAATATTLLLATGCSTTESGSSAAPGSSGARVVDHIVFDHPFTALPVWGIVTRFAQERADEVGVDLSITNDNMNLATQISTLQGFLSQDVDAVVSLPMDPASVGTIAAQFQEQGALWIAYGTDMDGQDGSLQFSFRESGRLLAQGAAEWAEEHMDGRAKVLVLEDVQNGIGIERTAGLDEGLEEFGPNLEIVARQQAVTPEEALSVTATVLAQHPDIDIVLAVTADGAQGAYQALVQSGRPADDSNTWVGGIDASEFVLDQMSQGNFLRGIVTYDPRALGYAVVDLPIAIASGEAEDPTYDVPVELVTSDDQPRVAELLDSLQ